MSRKEKILKLQQERLLYSAIENIIRFVEDGVHFNNANVKLAREIMEELVKQNNKEAELVEKEPTFKLFCYGTLKAGENNHPMLGADATFIANDVLPNKMVVSTNGLPYLLDEEGKVEGEIWEIGIEPYMRINRMEVGAGYKAKQVRTMNGIEVIAYFLSSTYKKYIVEDAVEQESY